MKSGSFSRNTNGWLAATTSSRPSAGESAAAFAPPPYGIDFVDRGSAAPPVQREIREEEEKKNEKPLQGKFDAASAQPDSRAAPPNRTGMPDRLKSGIESLSGVSMDEVKVHYNSSKPAQLNALAYAQGSDIHVAPGQERHVPHEAWHIVQQAQGRVQPTTQMKGGVPLNDDTGLEHEADVMGEKAARLG